MKLFKLIGICSLSFFSLQVFGYGSSSATKSCVAPRFDQFDPIEKTEVAPHSKFSFQASADIDIKSLKVTVKDQPANISISSDKQHYSISGVLPEKLNNTYARITISALGANGCPGSGGWLLKIKP